MRSGSRLGPQTKSDNAELDDGLDSRWKPQVRSREAVNSASDQLPEDAMAQSDDAAGKWGDLPSPPPQQDPTPKHSFEVDPELVDSVVQIQQTSAEGMVA